MKKFMKKFVAVVLAASLLLGSAVGIQAETAGNQEGGHYFSGNFEETIEVAVETAGAFMEAFSIPGVTMALVDAESGFTWMQGLGFADVENEIYVDEHTVFALGSIAKFFTAIAVMQLVEEGVIDLDTPLVEFLPEFSIPPSPAGDGDYMNVTPRMLLSHTSGILPNLLGHGMFTVDAYNPNHLNNLLDNLSAYFMSSTEDLVFLYNNNGFDVLGILVAYLTGEDNFFDDFVAYTDSNIFAVAGMESSSFILTDELLPNLAQPYIDAETLGDFVFCNGLPTGGLLSTAYDMATFMHLILSGGGDLISEESLEQMFAVHNFDFSASIGGIEYGLGVMHITGDDGFTMIGHNGALFSYHSAMLFDVDSGIGVFVSANSVTGLPAVMGLANAIITSAIVKKTGELPVVSLRADEEAYPIELSIEELEEVTGLYMGTTEYFLVELNEDGVLTLNITFVADFPGLPLTPMSDGSFLCQMLGRLWFDSVEVADEEIMVLRMGNIGNAAIALGQDRDYFVANDDFIHAWSGGTFVPIFQESHVSTLLSLSYSVDYAGFALFSTETNMGVTTAALLPVEMEDWVELSGTTDLEFDEYGRVIAYYLLGLRFERVEVNEE